MKKNTGRFHAFLFILLTAALLFQYGDVLSAPALKPMLKGSFITDTNNASSATKKSDPVKPGEKIYFYYKIGPLSSLKGKGAPFKTRLFIERNNAVLKDFGWQNANAANRQQMSKNLRLLWYHNCAWHFSFGATAKPGNYRAVVQHNDLNSGETITVSYHIMLAGTEAAVAPRAGSGRNVWNSVDGFYLGMTLDEARAEYKRCVVKTGHSDAHKTPEKEYLYISTENTDKRMMEYVKTQDDIWVYPKLHYITGPTPGTLIFSRGDRRLQILEEKIDIGSHSAGMVTARTNAFLKDMERKYGKYSQYVPGTYGGYIWKNGNYRVMAHYENMSGFAKFFIYHIDVNGFKSFKKIPRRNNYFDNMRKKMK